MYEPKDEECPVCFEPWSTRIMTTSPCGHVLCLPCLLQLRAASCPMCRSDLAAYLPPRSGVPKIHGPLHIMTSGTSTEDAPSNASNALNASNLLMEMNISNTSTEDETMESIFHLARMMRNRNGVLVAPLDTTPPVSPPSRRDLIGPVPSSPPSPRSPPSPPPRPSRLRHVFLSPAGGG